jgi:hypothetical protein
MIALYLEFSFEGVGLLYVLKYNVFPCPSCLIIQGLIIRITPLFFMEPAGFIILCLVADLVFSILSRI